MTAEARFKRYQERQAKKGLVVCKVYVPAEQVEKLKKYAARLRKSVDVRLAS